jgi:hypothetical protein
MQISELRDIIESSSDEEDYSDSIPDPGILPDGALIGDHDYAWSLDAFRLQYSQPARIEALWKVYLENVAPLIAIIHKGSMAQIVQNACSSVELTSSDEVLLFSVYFAAIVSMKPHVCPSVLGVDHDTAMEDCKKAVSQGLRRANFIKCQHLSTLQAAVLFLLCCRVGGDTRLVWAESAIVIRVAQAQGVHRDGSHFGLPPFETEIRRRLWWHICLLDMLSSRDQGVDTQIRPEIFDTQFPTNVDDQYLLLNMTQHPEPNIGFTNMTVCIMFSEIMIKILWSRDPGQSSDKSTYEKESLITEIGQGLHEKYLNHFDLDIPIQWVFATIIRLQLSQLWLSVHFQSGEGSQDFQHDDRVFEMAVEVLQFAYLLQTNEATAQWSWLCKSYKEWHVVAFILSELCIRPLSPETDHAWDVVTKMYTLWQSNHPRSDALLERPLDRLMKRTTTSRSARQGGQTRLFDEAAMSGVPSFGVGDAGFDLNEVPDLFMGLEWLSGPLF